MHSSPALEQRRTRVPRAEAWARIDRLLVDEAPSVPLYALREADFVSKRVGNYIFNPQFGVLLDQMWVRNETLRVGVVAGGSAETAGESRGASSQARRA